MKVYKCFFIVCIFVLLFSGQAFTQSGWETIFSGTSINDIAIQGDNILCATTSGIVSINKRTLESKTSNVEGDVTDNLITSVAVDAENNVWFGTFTSKIIKDDGQKWTVFSITENLPGSQINMIYCGKDGRIWAGVYRQGVYIFDGTKWEKFNHDFGKEYLFVMKMAVDSNNKTWFLTNFGLYMFNEGILKEVGNNDGFPGDSITEICSDRNNVLWAVSYSGGIYCLESDSWTEVVKDDLIGMDTLRKLTEAKTRLNQIINLEKTYFLTNKTYVDFEFGNSCPDIAFIHPGVGSNFEYSFNDNTAYAREINDINGDNDLTEGLTLTTNNIQGALEGSVLDWSFGQELSQNVMAAFDVGPDGTLWGGTMTGVVRYDENKKTKFTTADGLAGGIASSLNVESDGIVWVSSQYGLSRYVPPTTAVNSGNNSPAVFKIIGNYPNPFNPETTISFSLPDEKQISLIIYNINGQEIKTLFSGKMKSGVHSMAWNGKNSAGENVSSGIYLAVLKSGSMEVSQRIQLVR